MLVLACVVVSSASLILFLIRFADRHPRKWSTARERVRLGRRIAAVIRRGRK